VYCEMWTLINFDCSEKKMAIASPRLDLNLLNCLTERMNHVLAYCFIVMISM
jgi:hypothetical protein